jgi:hypothetical protein
MFASEAMAQNLRIFGYSQSLYQNQQTKELDGTARDQNSRSFYLQQTNLFFANRFNRQTSAFVNVEFVSNQDVKESFGNMSLQEAWFDYKFTNDFSGKFGKLLPKFGALNDQRNRTPIFNFTTRPVIYEGLYGDIFNQEAFVPLFAFTQIEKSFSITDKLTLEASAFVGNSEQTLLLSGDNRGNASDANSAGQDTTEAVTWGGKLNFVFSDYNVGIIKVGFSAATDKARIPGNIVPGELVGIVQSLEGTALPIGTSSILRPGDLGTARRLRWVADLSVQLDRIEILGEYAKASIDYTDQQTAAFNAMNQLTTGLGQAAFVEQNDSDFYWINGSYNFKNGAFLLGRYESLLLGNNNLWLNNERLKILTFGGGYRVNNIVFKTEYSIVTLKNAGQVPDAIENLFEVNVFKVAAGFTF